MAKRKIKLNEDDLKSFLADALRSAGFLGEDAEIVGLEYKTKTIKRGGDYYRDPADPTDKDPELVKFVWVHTETKGRRKKQDESAEQEETDG